jgi:hypothetical protein
MRSTSVRDCLETVLLAGIQVWGLGIAEHEVKDGVRLFEDDDEVLHAGECVGVPREKVYSFMTYLREHPGFLSSDEVRCALAQAGENWQVHGLVNEVMRALEKIEGRLRHQVDPEAFSTVLETLAFLAMGKFNPEVKRVCQEIDYPADGLRRYADGVVRGEWDMIASVGRAVLASELGSVVSVVVRRHARRVFSLALCAEYPALVAVLTDMAREILDCVVGKRSTNGERKENDK